MATKGGRKVIKARRQKGRQRLAVTRDWAKKLDWKESSQRPRRRA
jgi:hypothetical protein